MSAKPDPGAAGRKPSLSQRVSESPAYLPWKTPVASALAGFFIFPFAVLAALVPVLAHGGAWDIASGVVCGVLLAATGAHLLWETVASAKRQDRLTLGEQFRWRAVDFALFSSAFLIPWLIRSAGRWAQHN